MVRKKPFIPVGRWLWATAMAIVLVSLGNRSSTSTPAMADAVLAEAAEVFSVVKIGVSLVEYTYRVFSELFKDSGAADAISELSSRKDMDKKLMQEYIMVNRALDRLSVGFESIEAALVTIQRDLPSIIRRELELDRVSAIIRSVGNRYKMFTYYQDNRDKVERHTLEDFALSSTSHEQGSLIQDLVELNSLIVQQAGGHFGAKKVMVAGGPFDPNNGLVAAVSNGTNANGGIHLCRIDQSPQQLMFNLYSSIALTEIKGYAMIQFSYMMLRLYNKGNFTLESDLATKRFSQQAAEKLLAVKSVLNNVSRDYWRCDPSNPNLGVTYTALTRLLQGHIENEVDMNELKSCRQNCAAYGVTESKSCYKDLLCAKQRKCEGRLFDCQFYHADAWVCMSQDPGRMYEWVEYEDGRVLGKMDQCVNKIKVDSWWRWLFFHCSYCLCKCDSPGPTSDRFWSLEPAVANVGKNFIVTGARLVKKKRVLHLEVQQALALPEGAVDEDSRVWLEASPIDIDDNGTVISSASLKEDPSQNDVSVQLGGSSSTPSAPSEMDAGSKVMMMTYEQRAVDLDKLRAPPNHVITGIKLRNLGGHLNLEARVTPISFKDGQLSPEQSRWISNDNTPAATSNPRTQFHVVNPDIPTNFKGHSIIDASNDQFITFDTTSPETDVMQTTVPFIDVQDVAPNPGTWLSGIGLYHKGNPGFGGYLGLSVETLDYSLHLVPGKSATARSFQDELRYDFITDTK